jgi:predicted nucleic acid-binding protein
MTPLIVDASVAVKWFVDEPSRDGALSVLSAITADPKPYVVPELFFNEMLSVLARLTCDVETLTSHVSDLEGLGLARIANGHDLLVTAAKLCVEFRLSGYDAVYAALAKLMRGTWLTADAKAHKKVSALGLSRLV